MLFQLINEVGEFLTSNTALIFMVLAIVEYVKRWTENMAWVQSWMMTAFGFLLGFLFAVPELGFVGINILEFIAHGVALGLVATGLYKVGATLAEKANSKLV